MKPRVVNRLAFGICLLLLTRDTRALMVGLGGRAGSTQFRRLWKPALREVEKEASLIAGDDVVANNVYGARWMQGGTG